MSLDGGRRSFLAGIVLVSVAIGIGALVFLPGGSIDLAGLEGQVDEPEGGGTVTETGAQTGLDTATPPPDASEPSPWGKEDLVVAVRNPADPSRNVTPSVADALTF